MTSRHPSDANLWFLHRIDGPAGDAMLVDTDPARLRGATFLDGRERFWDGERIVDVADLPPAPRTPPPAFVFHMGFCGSTLIARLLDREGEAFVLREPQALADLASQQALVAESRAHLLGRSVSALSASGPTNERMVIKPSSWVNGLIPQLLADKLVGKAVFVTIERRAFLRACFRGGRDRLAYAMRLAALLAEVPSLDGRPIARIAEGGADALDQAARCVALLHGFQAALFRNGADIMAKDDVGWVDYDDLVADRASTMQRVRETFGLPHHASSAHPPGGERHAKDPSRAFSVEEQEAADREIERHHAARFEAAMAWADSVSGAASP